MDMMEKISSYWTTFMGGYLIARCSAYATVTHIKCQLKAPLWSLPARGSLSRAIRPPRPGTRRTVTRSHCSGDSLVFGGTLTSWNKSGLISLPTPSIFDTPRRLLIKAGRRAEGPMAQGGTPCRRARRAVRPESPTSPEGLVCVGGGAPGGSPRHDQHGQRRRRQ
ncbi:hypothetical protein [Beak and feather disease virus]|uniref:Uncharacterized protein V3 n=1 Tax=Beak and feather disease virus TaxID=77856 RepID=B3XX41_BFDV|nr:hypothetical protein [Beak and feather disease virus]